MPRSKTPKKPVKQGQKQPIKKTTKTKSKKSLRDQINALGIIEALEKHILGEVEMTATQVKAALALLKKTLPDISDATKKTNKKNKSPRHEDALKELE